MAEVIFDLDKLPKTDAEDNQKHGVIASSAAGIVSGLIKIPKGIASLAAELIDLGFDTNMAAEVEKAFDKINPFEEIANETLSGRILEGLIQIGIPSGVGASIATKIASKALQAKRAGMYANLTNPNLIKGAKEADKLNKLSTTQRYGAIAVGGGLGETLVADVEKIGNIGTAFEIGPTEMDLEERPGGREDATRKLMNRFKFGTESFLLAPFFTAATEGAIKLAKHGKDLAYSSSKLERAFDEIGSWFRFRGKRPLEQALAKEAEEGYKMADRNLAMEHVYRIDKEVNNMFPDTKKFFNAASTEEKNAFFKTLDESLFSGKLNEPLAPDIVQNLTDTMTKRGLSQEGINNIFTSLNTIRTQFTDLVRTASRGAGDVPEGLFSDVKGLLGDRIKNLIGNTYSIFDDKYAIFFQKYKPTQESVDRVKNIFMRYAAMKKNPITDAEAQVLVNDILEQGAKMNPKVDKIPTLKIQNLSIDAQKPYFYKTLPQTLEKEIAGGTKEIQIIGKGSKAFRELFGETNDVRRSIFEGMNRLSSVARRNELYNEMLSTDLLIKAKTTAETPFGQRGFFHDSPLEAQRAFGPGIKQKDIVQLDNKYIKDDVAGAGLANELKGKWTTKDIAEGFTSSSRVQDFMRGDTATGTLEKGFSWAYRNLVLVPKSISQYAKTILSIPTQVKNFLANGAFTLSNGTIFEAPEIMLEAAKKAGMTVQLGVRQPLNMDRYRRYLQLQVANTNVHYNDLKNILSDAKIIGGNINSDSLIEPMLKSMGKLGDVMKKTGNVMQSLYVTADDVFKIFNFEVELARRSKLYAKAGVKKTVDELEKEAAEIVKNTVPSYNRVGQLIRLSRMSPFGNFMSFPSEIYRTGTGIAEQIIKDLKDPITGSLNPLTSTNPMKSIAMKRLFGATTAFATLPYGVVEGTKALYGVSDDEARAADDFVAPWSKDSQKMYFKNPETGEISFIDFSRNNSYDTLVRPFKTLLRNIQEGVDKEGPLLTGFVKGIAEAAGNVASPFVDPSIYSETLLNVFVRDGMTNEGKQLWTKDTPLNEKVSRAISHVTEAFYPSYQPFARTYKALTEKPGKGGEMFEVPNELGGIFGLRLEKINPERSMGFYITDFQEGQRNARKEFTGGPEGTLSGEIKTPEDLIQRYYVANKSLFNTQQKMAIHMQNAQILGMDQGNLAQLFKDRGLSRQTTLNLNDGRFQPFYPSDDIVKKFQEIAEKTGQTNPYFEAQPILKAMQEAFRTENLFSTFKLNLKDFMPSRFQEAPTGSRSALPPTPQPNLGILTSPVTQIAGLQNGLTVAENALLSESEKQIRLKQRGLA